VNARLSKWWRVLLVLWAISFWLSGREDPATWGLNNVGWLCLLAVWAYAMVVPHELCHAGAAKLLGMRVDWIAVGRPPFRWQARWFGIRWKLSPLPVAGHVAASFREHGALPLFWRLRLGLLIAAGPAVHGVALVGLTWLGRQELSPLGSVAVDAGWWANLTLLVLNLNPFSGRGGHLASDGAQLLGLVRRSVEVEALWRTAGLRHQAVQAVEDGEPERALALLQAIPVRDAGLSLTYAAVLGTLGRLDEALAQYQRVLDDPSAARRFQLLAANDSAWYLAVLDRDIDRADALSREALEALPGQLAAQSTRGAVLARLGRLDEARPLLEAATAETRAPADQASSLAFLGLIEGNPAVAAVHLARARALDPDNLALRRVWPEVAGPTAG